MKKTILFILIFYFSFITNPLFAFTHNSGDTDLLNSFKEKLKNTSSFDQCSTIFAVPFHETFNSTSTSLNCWNAFNLNNDNVSWTNTTTNTYEGNGAKQLAVQNLTYGSTNDWLVSPNINLDAVPGTKELKFYVKLSPHVHANWRVDQVIKVAISSTGGTSVANFTTTLLPGKTFQNDFYVEVKVDLVNPVSNLPLTGVINVGFHVNRTAYPLGRGVYLDDVIIDVKPTCSDVTDLVACVSNSAIDFSWTPGGNETQWEYCIVTAGQPPLTNGTILNSNSFSTTGLLADTWYTVWVRALCSGTSKSNWTPEYFKTVPSVIQANPFCGDSGAIVFQNNFGGTNTSGYGPIGCLGFSPNAIWYYFEVSSPGNLEFNIIQNTQFNASGAPIGTPLDVDYVAFGPYNSLDQACSNVDVTFCSTCPGYQQVVNPGAVDPNFYPYGDIVDCSPSPAAIETLSIPNAQVGQIYVVLIANWDGLPGFIKLEQTNSNDPGAGSTDCDFLCEIDLGEDITVCNTDSVQITGSIETIGNGEITSIQWFKDEVLLDVNVYNSLTITVTETGTYKVIIEKENCTQATIEDEIMVTFIDPFDSSLVPTTFLVCDVEPDGIQTVDFDALTSLFVSEENLSNYQIYYFTSNQDALDQVNPIDTNDYQISNSQTVYVRISTIGFENCVTIVPIELNFREFENPTVNFAYQNPICKSNHGSVSPILPSDFSLGGIFSGSAGLIINSVTGEIDVTQTPSGTYQITYDYVVEEPRCGESKSYETTIQITRDIDIIIQGGCFENKYELSVLDLTEDGAWQNLIYQWSGEGKTSNVETFVIEQSGTYEVTVVTPEGCTQTATVKLEDINCIIPKGISPNNDGLNDNFRIENIKIVSLKIYNRYGKEVYTHGLDYKDQWYGQNHNGEILPSGTYFYAIETPKETLTGWVQLVREE